ncbi:MAG TPA: bifunctional enoyl-CoA hydratase/phosphate acetyltransferase, partial [Burkholderiales bacterium]|nr:bifunctional enoyl-CoA hydratase/phosphate acetyltransferase [Burkholderiales bacterium]
LAPTEKIKRPRIELPGVTIVDRAGRYRNLLERAKGMASIPMAVVHPCNAESLGGALAALQAELIIPILVGPEKKIRALAAEHELDLGSMQIVDAPHSHAAAAQAVALVRAGRAEALMKGSLHTEELMGAVVAPDAGLRTARRVSHVFFVDVPTYPRPLLITDAAINIEPMLPDKVDIVQNAIDLAHVLGVAEPKVAILAAVEMVNPAMRATTDAAALCKMAERGQITGGILDGPLAFDNAVSLVAARTKGIRSAVAGRADILVVPDLESGNMLAKQLEYLAEALLAGVVVGASAPIVLTSRADSTRSRVASCAVAVLMAHARRQQGN